MTVKEFIRSRVQLFFFLTTMILFVSAVMGEIFAPEKEIRYYHLFSPLIISGMCVLITSITCFRKEPTLRQYIVRHIIEILMIQISVISIITPPENVKNSVFFYVILCIAILIIYVLAALMMWWQKYRQSQTLTAQLKKLQSKV